MPTRCDNIVGWDIGGVQTKAALLRRGQDIRAARVHSEPFEIWRQPQRLPDVLGAAAKALQADGSETMAVTMTAELSDAFRSKREGVRFILDALRQAFPAAPILPLSLQGRFVALDDARQQPLDFAASNWLAAALFAARRYPDGILVDIGSTTTDIIPLRDGRVACRGRTDPERLATGELVYTGAVRTNPNTLAPWVPLAGRQCRVAAEYFAIMADVYLLLGDLSPVAYTGPTPDGRAKTSQAAAERLARLACADAESLGEEQVRGLAVYLRERQLQQIGEALCQVLSAQSGAWRLPLLVTGSGRFLAAELGRRLGLPVHDLAAAWGEAVTDVLPCLAVAALLADASPLGDAPPTPTGPEPAEGPAHLFSAEEAP